MGDIEDSIRSISETTVEITKAVSNLPESVIRRKPAPDVWSIQEILAHIQEAVPYWAGEMQRVVTSPGVEWGRNHQNEARLSAVASSSQRNSADLIDGIHTSSDRAIGILRSIRDQDLQIESPSRNPRWGIKPISFILDHLIVSHMKGHLNQIRRNLDQFSLSGDKS